jgi:hypothetical protein
MLIVGGEILRFVGYRYVVDPAILEKWSSSRNSYTTTSRTAT